MPIDAQTLLHSPANGGHGQRAVVPETESNHPSVFQLFDRRVGGNLFDWFTAKGSGAGAFDITYRPYFPLIRNLSN